MLQRTRVRLIFSQMHGSTQRHQTRSHVTPMLVKFRPDAMAPSRSETSGTRIVDMSHAQARLLEEDMRKAMCDRFQCRGDSSKNGTETIVLVHCVAVFPQIT